MHLPRRLFHSLFSLALLAAILFPFQATQVAFASSLTSVSDTLSSTKANTTGVTHTVAFTTATTDNIKRVTVRFSTAQGGTTKPAGLDVSSATLGTVTGLGSSWTINTTFVSTGVLYIERTTAASVSSGVSASIDFAGITNSAINDCQPSDDVLEDVCWATVTTYSDDGITAVDAGDTNYTVHEDPKISFEVLDVPAGQTHNGVTSDISTTDTSVSYGHIGGLTVRYGTQKLLISTNAPHGYGVWARLVTNLRGEQNTNSEISPFGATGATWSTPQTWSSPDGTVANSNTGWFGYNTSDTAVGAGWSSASGKFGPLGTTERKVAYSSTPQPSTVTVYISYAIEVNPAQPSDHYSAHLVYDIRPIF